MENESSLKIATIQLHLFIEFHLGTEFLDWKKNYYKQYRQIYSDKAYISLITIGTALTSFSAFSIYQIKLGKN